MILAELELENYKQFAGIHRFEPTPNGVVGIIGPNGVGKTTLFEAIEWCLFNPREIKNDEINPRGKAGRPRVKVGLDDPMSGVRYVIQRELMKSGVKAEIWTGGEDGPRIVHGSAQVTDYVTKTLLGLDHRAFVSTFFTRQKELSFFAGSATDRRREVSRLLGYETIREAQQSIAKDRQAADNEADVLAVQYKEQSEGRDFAEEIAACDAEIASCQVVAAKAADQLTTASAELLSARDRLKGLQALEKQDNELLRMLERIDGGIREATARRDGAIHELERINESEQQRSKLAPVAAAEPKRRAAVAAHERDRERYGQVSSLQANIDRAKRDLDRDLDQLEQTVIKSSNSAFPEWAWTGSDRKSPIEAATRLIEFGDQLEIVGARARYESLEKCLNLANDRDQAEVTLHKYEQRLAEYKAKRAALLASGDPKNELERTDKQRTLALSKADRHETAVESLLKSQQQYVGIIGRLQARQMDGVCETCGRPFSEADIPLTIAALEDRIDQINSEVGEHRQREQSERDEAAAFSSLREAASNRLNEVIELNGKISHGESYVEDARAALEKTSADLNKALVDGGRDKAPTKVEVEQARAQTIAIEKIGAALGVVRQLQSNMARSSDEIAAEEKTIAALGPVVYDKDAHDSAESALEEARAAETTIRQIDRDIARRPQLEADRDKAIKEIDRLGDERTSVEKERAGLAFEPEALQSAISIEQTALDAERAALHARNEAQNAQRTAETARTNIVNDQERITGLATRADVRRREADNFRRMYDEFNLFDQYVVNLITPRLAAHASQLVADITEGKYDRIEFDEDYGIRVFDGDEHFPIEEFSGGERDVIALCARLALSQIIGGQANRPLSFLVLDEVFGSLDRERRANLMSTLTQLSGSAEAFTQLFIISHVDVDRQASDFNEFWRVSETGDGVSHLENLTATGGIEEF